MAGHYGIKTSWKNWIQHQLSETSGLNFIHSCSSSTCNERLSHHAFGYVKICAQIHTSEQLVKEIIPTIKKCTIILFASIIYSRAQYSGIDQAGWDQLIVIISLKVIIYNKAFFKPWMSVQHKTGTHCLDTAAKLKKTTDYLMSHHTVFLEYLILFHKATHFAVTVIVCIASKQIWEALYKQVLFIFLLPTLSQMQITQASKF